MPQTKPYTRCNAGIVKKHDYFHASDHGSIRTKEHRRTSSPSVFFIPDWGGGAWKPVLNRLRARILVSLSCSWPPVGRGDCHWSSLHNICITLFVFVFIPDGPYRCAPSNLTSIVCFSYTPSTCNCFMWTNKYFVLHVQDYCPTQLHLVFSDKLRIWQVPACKMEPRSGNVSWKKPPTHPTIWIFLFEYLTRCPQMECAVHNGPVSG